MKVYFKVDKKWISGEVIGKRRFERVEQVFMGQVPRTWAETKFLIKTDDKKAFEVWESETYESIPKS